MNFQDGSSVLQRQLLLQFGDRLRRLRKARKLSTVEMAKRVGISRTTLSAVEAGDPAPSIGTYLRVMAELGIGADMALLYGGSVKPGNAAEIFAIPHVNGALVGGASLKAADFGPIVAALSAA